MPSSEYLTSDTGDAVQASSRPCWRFLRTRSARPAMVTGFAEVSGRAGGNGIDHVRLDAPDVRLADEGGALRPDPRLIFGGELLDGAAVSASEHHRPPVVRRPKRMVASFGLDLALGHAGSVEECAERVRLADAIPRTIWTNQIRSHTLDSIPENAVDRFPEPWAPGRNRDQTAGPREPDERSRGARRIGDEENAEHADHDVEAGLRQPEIEQVATPELGVCEAATLRFRACQGEQLIGEIDAEHGALRADLLGCRNRRRATPAAHGQDAGVRGEAQPLDRPLPETIPERVRRIVVEIRGGVVCRRRLLLCLEGHRRP